MSAVLPSRPRVPSARIPAAPSHLEAERLQPLAPPSSRPSPNPDGPLVDSASPAGAGRQAGGQGVDGTKGASIAWSAVVSIDVDSHVSGHKHSTRGLATLFERGSVPRVDRWSLPGGA